MRHMAVGRQIESDFHRGCGENKRGGSLWPPSWGGGNRDGPALAHLRRHPFASHLLRYSRLNVSASARVRSASCIFLSFSVTSSTRAYTKSRIAARTASDRLGKSSTSTRKSRAFRYRAGRRNVIFSVSASRKPSPHPWVNPPYVDRRASDGTVTRYIMVAGIESFAGTPL